MVPSPRAAESERTTDERAAGLRLALAGGGTGGHIVPGLHFLAHLRARADELPLPLADVVWCLSGRPVEERVLAGLDASPFPRVVKVPLALEPETGGAPSRAGLAWRTAPAVLRARRALAGNRCEVLLGLGGYTSLPAVLAARSLGIPVGLYEVNAVPGAATRALARFSARVFHAWPSAPSGAATWPSGAATWIGPLLAPEFLRGAPSEDERRSARAALGFEPALPLLVVLGGSQGAGALNRFVAEHARAIVRSGVQILHQTGPGRLGEGCDGLRGYVRKEYLDQVGRALAAATLVLCRGGASTLAEVAALRVPALVVPYPHHKDRHQEHNARALGGGARVVDEGDLGTHARDVLIRLAQPEAEQDRARMRAALESSVPLRGADGFEGAASRLYDALIALSRKRSFVRTSPAVSASEARSSALRTVEGSDAHTRHQERTP